MAISSSNTLKITKASLLKRVFSDPKNYPYGFSRSGDFSIAESKALSAYGCYFAALVDGELKPANDEDIVFLDVVHGDKEPQDTAQRAWIKYQKRINRPKAASIYGSKPSQNNSQEQDDELAIDDVDDGIQIDLDE